MNKTAYNVVCVDPYKQGCKFSGRLNIDLSKQLSDPCPLCGGYQFSTLIPALLVDPHFYHPQGAPIKPGKLPVWQRWPWPIVVGLLIGLAIAGLLIWAFTVLGTR